jgi:hypothetical protein
MDKIKVLAMLLMLFLGSSSFTGKKQNCKISTEIHVISLEYYSICDCSEKSPILVRVTFQFSGNDLYNYKMVQKYEGEITKTVDITVKDKRGNPVYDFCSDDDKIIEFSTYFIGTDGTKTNEIIVKADVINAKIIEGTAPALISVN